MSGFFYAIGDERCVKLGYSADPCRRRNQIQRECASAVSLIGLVPATRSQEAKMHRLLTAWCIEGEWYWRKGPVAILVDLLPKAKPRKVVDRHPLDVWLDAEGKTRQWLAKRLVTTEATISRLMSGKQRPGWNLILGIEGLTQKKVTRNDFGRSAAA